MLLASVSYSTRRWVKHCCTESDTPPIDVNRRLAPNGQAAKSGKCVLISWFLGYEVSFRHLHLKCLGTKALANRPIVQTSCQLRGLVFKHFLKLLALTVIILNFAVGIISHCISYIKLDSSVQVNAIVVLW